MRVLLTGGFGFIGSGVAEHIIRTTNWEVIILDKLTYATMGFERLKSSNILFSPRVKYYTWDLIQPLSSGLIKEIGNIDVIFHLAAETHVDNSIKDPVYHIKNNVISTVNMLEYARNIKNLKIFFYFSTDEVYGPAPDNVAYKEWDRHRPTNPYSASKSCGGQISIAYENTYKVPVIIVNVMNAFGERQHVEKFIPKVIKKVINNELVEIHSDPECIKPGSRFYIHIRNIADALLFLVEHGEIGERYNIQGEREMSNLELAQFIANIVGKELKYKLVNFHQERPGHDLRYCLDGTKLKELGWVMPKTFEESLIKTINWTLKNQEWLKETF
jgi:dTDP-glucose 4,6-dehydratase